MTVLPLWGNFGIMRGSLRLQPHHKETTMINSLKAEIERRTGLPASAVDQVITALGEIISERYPQYAGMIGPLLGIPMSGSASAPATGTPTMPSGQATGGGQGMPDLTGIEREIGKFMGG